MKGNLKSLRIILVEPAGGLNVGSIARVMKNMGLFRLVLVRPQCDPLGDDARKMAVHADDVLAAAEVVDSMEQALHGCHRVVAATARARGLTVPVETCAAGLPWLLNTAPETAALIFGPEDRGLSNAELIHAQKLITIPAADEYPVMNLAQAVAVCCYELHQLGGPSPDVTPKGQTPSQAPAAFEQLEGYYNQLEELLLDIGYLHSHTTKSQMEKFRILYNRCDLTENEVAMLRGILGQTKWAIKNSKDT